MQKINILLNGTILYSALFYIQNGLRGKIEVYLYDETSLFKEKNEWGDFYLTETGELHLNRTYQYKEHAGYILAFSELQRMLYKVSLEEDVILATNYTLIDVLINKLKVPTVQVEVRSLTNIENLAYLFEYMMRYNCSSSLTSDFIEKLDYYEVTNDFEASALLLRENLEYILTDDTCTEDMKREKLEQFMFDNIQIFADYERAQKENTNNGPVIP